MYLIMHAGVFGIRKWICMKQFSRNTTSTAALADRIISDWLGLLLQDHFTETFCHSILCSELSLNFLGSCSFYESTLLWEDELFNNKQLLLFVFARQYNPPQPSYHGKQKYSASPTGILLWCGIYRLQTIPVILWIM